MSKDPNRPPKWMDWLIQSYCRTELLEDLQGDLHEYYERNCRKNRARANLIYFVDVLKFCRLYTVRKPKIFKRMNTISVFKNYFKTSVRSLRRNKLFSSINVFGLAVSMSIGILMITYISELLSYDQFHENRDKIYRVLSTYQSKVSNANYETASTSVFIGRKIQEEYQDLDKVLIMRRDFVADLEKGTNIISAEGHYSTKEFFDVFSFELKAGNPVTALSEPYSLVITETLAQKLFKDVNPVGETVQSGDKIFTITGLMEDTPANSHLQFEMLASFSTVELEERKNENSRLYRWSSIWNDHVYLLLSDEQKPSQIQAGLDRISKEENGKSERYSIDFKLENLLDVVPGSDLSNQMGPNMAWTEIYQLMALTLIVIVSACFNYTNLSIARSLRRAKEVGVRKIVGASRLQVFVQFVVEAIIISSLALMIALGLYLIIKPHFVTLILEGEPLDMTFEWIHIFYFFLFAVFVGFWAGVLPSIFLSKLKAISTLRDVSTVKLFKGISLRRVLIVFQFAVSMALIIGATISYKQYQYALNFDLGFSTENVLNVSLQENESNIVMTEMERLSEVVEISRSLLLPNTNHIWNESFKYDNPLDSATVNINYVDKNYLDLHQYDLVAGESFPYDVEEGDPKFIIVDEAFRERFGFATAQEAIGEVVYLNRREKVEFEITGVVRNFQYVNISSESIPCALLQGISEDYNHLNLLVKTDDVVGMMDKLESIWRQIDNVHPFEATFYDEQIQEAYNENAVMFKLFGFLATLAVAISALGLLGMAVFTTETRIKEISIRKVLGATERGLVIVLSRGFLLMLGISALVAVPATYLLFESIILVEYANRITIGVFELLSGVVLIFMIGALTVSWQTWKAAKTNPAEMLRNE